jgi:hypothetical protein
MSETNQYLVYYIYLSDLALIQSLQGSLVTPAPGVVGNGIGAILAAPDDAAVTYSAPKLAAHATVVAPCIGSSWFGTEDHFPTNVASFDRKSGGWFGWSFLFGDTTHYHWRGIFVYAPAADPPGGPTLQNIMPRRWVDGFELVGQGEGGTGTGTYSREASRHVEGLGLMLRSSTNIRSHSTNERGGAAAGGSWERFYVRLRGKPAASTTLWYAHSTVSSNAGIVIQITPTGQMAVFSSDSIGGLTLLGTAFTLDLDAWHRIDIQLIFGGGVPTYGPATKFEMWVDGTDVLVVSPIPGTTLHASSDLGAATGNTLAIDVDDWMNADKPATPDGIDFQSGSGMFLVTPIGLDPASSVNWVGDYRALAQMPKNNANASVTSATAAAALIALTDAQEVIGENAESIGVVAMVAALGATGVQAANALGFIGTDLTGTLTGLGVALGSGFISFLWNMVATPHAIKPTNPIKLTYNHGNAGATTVTSLHAVAELIGCFGPEDVPHVTPAPKTLPTQLGMHNAPYPRTPWARLTTTPQQPVLIVTGTYVGNGVGQDLHFAVPVHFFRTRPLVAEAGGAIWWSSLSGAHTGTEKQWQASHLADARINPAFVPGGLDAQQQDTILSIVGNHTQSNANGVTYAYVAICDPGMRFLLNACIKDPSGTVDHVTTLKHPRFTPLAGFFFFEQAGGTTTQLWFKGPGHLAQSLSVVSTGGETTNALQFGLASMTNRTAFNGLGAADSVGVALFRNDDTSGKAGKVLQITSYVGNGAASRSIALTPASGKRPMWGCVLPHTFGAGAVYRDPSHTGTQSSAFNGGINAATGITGGDIDTIIVDGNLNQNGVGYEVFVIPGDTVAGNNGWSVAGTFMPVDPNPPPDAPFDALSPQEPPSPPVDDPTPPPSPLPDPVAPTGPMPGLADDLDPACKPDTQRIVNVALSRLGISIQVVDLATDATAEAATMRLEYADAVQATLRDFPWPFATRYAQLAVVATTPNSDWAFSYRQPTDCLFERRLVVNRTGSVDPEPPAFQLATDDTGGLIFTNLANAVLEYTARPKCPHTRSEPLFRDAVAWKLAAAGAPALSRMTDAAINCTKMYWATIEQARQVLRPNNPGEAAAATTVDVSVAAKAANVSVVNLALVRIGARTIRNLTTDQSREAQTARLIFERELRTVLRDFPWAFATSYVAPVLVGGTVSTPVNGDWQYSYRLPTDLIFARRLVSAARRAYERNPPTFKLAQDATGGLLFTDVAPVVAPNTPAPILEYTARIEAAVLVSDALFQDAFAWKLAATLAPALALAIPETPEQIGRGPEDPKAPKERPATGAQLRTRAGQIALQMYHVALQKAAVAAANEAEPDLDQGQADWIDSRDGLSRDVRDRWGWDR